jgi:hypothetical protein
MPTTVARLSKFWQLQIMAILGNVLLDRVAGIAPEPQNGSN